MIRVINKLSVRPYNGEVYNINNITASEMKIREFFQTKNLDFSFHGSDINASGRFGLTEASELDFKLSVNKNKTES